MKIFKLITVSGYQILATLLSMCGMYSVCLHTLRSAYILYSRDIGLKTSYGLCKI